MLTDFVIFGGTIFYALAVAAVFVLRWKHARRWSGPTAPGAIPLTPHHLSAALRLLVVGSMLLSSICGQAAVGSVCSGAGVRRLDGVGLVLYAIFRRLESAQQSQRISVVFRSRMIALDPDSPLGDNFEQSKTFVLANRKSVRCGLHVRLGVRFALCACSIFVCRPAAHASGCGSSNATNGSTASTRTASNISHKYSRARIPSASSARRHGGGPGDEHRRRACGGDVADGRGRRSAPV